MFSTDTSHISHIDAHYPNLDIDKCAEVTEDAISASEIEVNLNETELALFVAATHIEEYIKKAELEKVVHSRRYNRGARPGVTCTVHSYHWWTESQI